MRPVRVSVQKKKEARRMNPEVRFEILVVSQGGWIGGRGCYYTSAALKKRIDNPLSVMSVNRFTSPMLSRHAR